MNRAIILGLAVSCCIGLSQSHARLIENWPYERLFKEADLIVIATAESTVEAKDKFNDERWPPEFAGRNTTFKIVQVVKGKGPDKELVVLHFKFAEPDPKSTKKNGPTEIIDGPMFVYFGTKPLKKIEINGMEVLNHKLEYMLFLKKRADGRYEPVSGRIDPVLSVREMFEPYFSRDDKEERGK
jgi:hypothetical protein